MLSNSVYVSVRFLILKHYALPAAEKFISSAFPANASYDTSICIFPNNGEISVALKGILTPYMVSLRRFGQQITQVRAWTVIWNV